MMWHPPKHHRRRFKRLLGFRIPFWLYFGLWAFVMLCLVIGGVALLEAVE